MNVRKIKNFFLFIFFILILQKLSLAEEQKNLIISQSNSYSNKNSTFISFEDFKQEFTYTNSIGDYFRSIQRVKIKYFSENLINKNLGLYDEVEDLKKQEILDLVKLLTIEAWSKTNFKINKFFRIITKDKKHTSRIINIKGRNFKIENFYEGIARFNFDDLCNRNLGAEDYLEIIKNCKFITLDHIPQFNDINSNQQQRFITLIDVIYDKNIPLAVTAEQNIDQFTSSRLLESSFKRTISRLYELTSVEKN